MVRAGIHSFRSRLDLLTSKWTLDRRDRNFFRRFDEHKKKTHHIDPAVIEAAMARSRASDIPAAASSSTAQVRRPQMPIAHPAAPKARSASQAGATSPAPTPPAMPRPPSRSFTAGGLARRGSLSSIQPAWSPISPHPSVTTRPTGRPARAPVSSTCRWHGSHPTTGKNTACGKQLTSAGERSSGLCVLRPAVLFDPNRQLPNTRFLSQPPPTAVQPFRRRSQQQL